jgi:TfuA protein
VPAEPLPIVFAGPSLAQLPAVTRGRIELRPPARRGDLEALIQRDRPGVVVLIDGLFGWSLAVTPTECRELLLAGWTLCGASSIGALRASELWSVGMIGIGEVYAMLRLGHIRADDELAVAYHPDTHEELGASLVHVRYVLDRIERHLPSPEVAPRALALARELYWLERSWPRLFARWREHGITDGVIERARAASRDPRCHPKVLDAELAVRTVLASTWIPSAT